MQQFKDQTDELEPRGPVDSDEEKELIMAAIARSRPQPLVTKPLISTRSKYQYIRMKEVLRNALGGARGSGLFATSYGDHNPANATLNLNTMGFANTGIAGPLSASVNGINSMGMNMNMMNAAAGFGSLAAQGAMPPPIDTNVANMHRMGGMNSAALLSAGLGGGDSLFGSPLTSAGVDGTGGFGNANPDSVRRGSGMAQTPRSIAPMGRKGSVAG
jgi:hypothetical protein